MQEYQSPATYELDPSDTVVKLLLAQAKARPHGVMFTRPQNYEWVNVTAKEFVDEVYEVAKGLIANGVQAGDRVILFSETRYEWSLMDFAIWAAGASSVPIYGSSSQSQVQWIIEDSGAVFAVTEKREHTELMSHLVLQADGSPQLVGSPSQLRRVLEINASAIATLKFEGRGISNEEVDARINNAKADELASLVYTSGTTGRPKGCYLTHANWVSEVRGLLAHPIGGIAVPGTRVLTFLPLAHVLARAVYLACVVGGATQSHWSDFRSLTVELQRSRPNLLLGVPRVFEKVRNAAAANAADKSPVAAAVFLEAEKVAMEYSRSLDADGPSRSLRLKHKMFDRLVYSKIREAMGGEVKYCISGGSAISHDLLHFFRGIGVPIYEGYGLTETSAAAAVDFEPQRIGTVGRPVGGMAARINDDGEILLKGNMLCKGYWNNPEATADAIQDGWFNTGDLGEITEDGYLIISGRKKDLIVTAGGKNVSPGPMEDLLRSHPMISQALVVGDGKPFIGALITLDEDAFRRWKLVHNLPEKATITELALNPQLRADIQDAVNHANDTVSHTEAIKKFYILDRDLSEEADELTPTMKVKRNVVTRRFAKEIAHIYTR
ncbi:Long-chain-fatty-acid--CoA ligase FadD15 [Corynebacterium kalinowskii]|uniref:Acyl-CoA synthetase n=1 Tax=Corynebacterium kalinowskii TaxID=2675216 RepID=A0A6B8V933_9CORY|nr:long-chain fatty acid--CoA ligase [Corynebacterium kalinowskii]QGU01592.1 Long-chain-fatty-acid--CoA ligase FadD15 [Corynebacterium kalinowskii]